MTTSFEFSASVLEIMKQLKSPRFVVNCVGCGKEYCVWDLDAPFQCTHCGSDTYYY